MCSCREVKVSRVKGEWATLRKLCLLAGPNSLGYITVRRKFSRRDADLWGCEIGLGLAEGSKGRGRKDSRRVSELNVMNLLLYIILELSSASWPYCGRGLMLGLGKGWT